MNNYARLIAYYLPQFHPIPENDRWWGKGFTEWTNVARAKRFFPSHYQPRLPADLGFYDLRVPDVRIAQAEMARQYGIEAFCYWHYWFEGKQYLERPFNEVLESKEPDFPICLAWANHSWAGAWQSAFRRTLMLQTYPGIEDHKKHFYTLLNAFTDRRYVTCEGKPIFIIYRPSELPEPRRFTDLWRDLAIRSGLKGIYFLAVAEDKWVPDEDGYDASICDSPNIIFKYFDQNRSFLMKAYRRLNLGVGVRLGVNWGLPTIYQYCQAIEHGLPPLDEKLGQYPCVIPNWDNTPRAGSHGIVFHNSTPKLFRRHFGRALQQISHREKEKRFVFIKSWNEWAEGNYLEPDQRFGLGYLQAIKEEMDLWIK